MTDEMIGTWDVNRRRKYPVGAKLCDYIVVTEFDIDSGSTVRHQYPENIVGVSEDWLAENMLPEGAHNRNTDSTFMILNRDKPRFDEEWLQNPSLTTADSGSHETTFCNRTSEVFRYGLNMIHTKHDASVRRGAVVKAMAVFSSYNFVDSLGEPLQIALEKYFECPERKVLEDLCNSLNRCDLHSVPHPSLLEKSLMQWGTASNPQGVCSLPHSPSTWSHRLYVPRLGCLSSDGENSNSESFAISIPLYRDLDGFGDISISTLLRTFGDASMRIYSAILSRQRVIFVGYNHAARDVCCMVLSAVAAVSPLPNVLRRAYPYANLTDLSFLETVGFIAGVTNPMFLERDQWWDLACVMDLPNGTGAVYNPEEKRRADEHSKGGSLASAALSSSSSSSRGGHILGGNILANVGGRLLPFENAEITQQHVQDSADSRFVTGMLSAITTKAFKSVSREEEWVARRFFDYTSHILDIARDPLLFLSSGCRGNKVSDFDSSSDRMKRSPPEGVTARTAALRSSPEFLLMPSSPWVLIPPDVSATVETPSGPISDESDEQQRTLRLPPMSVSPLVPFDADHYSLLRTQLRSLQHSAHSIRTETLTLFSDLLRVLRSEGSAQAMLSLLPLSLGGLDPIGMGLLHPNPTVRLLAVEIIKKVKQYPSTSGAVDVMNSLLLFAFERQVTLCDSGEMEHLIAAYDMRLAAAHEDRAAGKSFSNTASASHSPRLFGSTKSRVGPLPSSSATSPTSSCPDSSISPTPHSATGVDDLPSSFLSFAAAAGGLLTGILSSGEIGPESDNVTTRRGVSRAQEGEEQHDRQSIDLIHY